MIHIILAALAAATAGIVYFAIVLVRKRRELEGLPCPPMKSLLFGHLYIAAECQKLFPPDCHVHAWMPYVQKKYGLGDTFYLDWWPLGPRWIFMSDPEMISQNITTTKSVPKSPLVTQFMNDFLGTNNMVTSEGQHWKLLRSMFNPGFSASHLMTLTPYIVDASLLFYDIVCKKVETNELFELGEYATRLTIDIIGKVVLDSDLDAQRVPHPLVTAFHERVQLMPANSSAINLTQFQYWRRLKAWFNKHKLERLIGEEFDKKMTAREASSSGSKSLRDRKRSAVDLALDWYEKEYTNGAGGKQQGNRRVDPAFRQNTLDSMKTFIFAGHDTTASTIAYVFYCLHLHPDIHRKVVAELDRVFSPGAATTSVADTLKADPYIINRLEYITAVIKETLRLFPPASSLRWVPPESDPNKITYMTDPKTGQKLPLSGWHIWPQATLVHRNEKFFPRPIEFIPERFIPSLTPFPEAKLFAPEGKDAWRPFEKGPRNCIGQELAMIELKIIMALVVRDLDFVAEYDGRTLDSVKNIETYKEYADGKPGTERMTIEGHRAFQMLRAAAKPKDNLPGRMYFRKPQ